MRLALIVLLLLTACTDKTVIDTSGPDQCLRIELFHACMKALPAGPQSTQYNDWDEVVSECSKVAYYQSLRKTELIKPECRA